MKATLLNDQGAQLSLQKPSRFRRKVSPGYEEQGMVLKGTSPGRGTNKEGAAGSWGRGHNHPQKTAGKRKGGTEERTV